jgi:LPS sulfotransferase NodH
MHQNRVAADDITDGREETAPERSGSPAARCSSSGVWFHISLLEPIDISYPVLWRNLTDIVGTILEKLGQDPRLAPAPALERQADQRSDEWVDRYRADAQREGLPT